MPLYQCSKCMKIWTENFIKPLVTDTKVDLNTCECGGFADPLSMLQEEVVLEVINKLEIEKFNI